MDLTENLTSRCWSLKQEDDSVNVVIYVGFMVLVCYGVSVQVCNVVSMLV